MKLFTYKIYSKVDFGERTRTLHILIESNTYQYRAFIYRWNCIDNSYMTMKSPSFFNSVDNSEVILL